MAGANACVTSQYFSGQGAFLLAERDISGQPLGFRPVGNVSALSIAIETTEFEHKESCTGTRAIDLTIVQEINATMAVTMESLDRENLALALYGSSSAIVGASVVDEPVTGYEDRWSALQHIDISNLVVTDAATGLVTYVDGVDYLCNELAGSIFVLSSGSITDMEALFATYDFTAQDDVQAVLTSTGAERYCRFEGLNTAQDPNSSMVVNVFKAQVQPLTELALISDEITQMEVEFKILSDVLSIATSNFFEIRKSNGG